MDISKIYPEGIKVAKNSFTTKKTVNPELKRKVLEMLGRGIKIVRVCEKFNVDKTTIYCWQKAKERY